MGASICCKKNFFSTRKAFNGAPSVIGYQTAFSRAIVLPVEGLCIKIFAQTGFVGDERNKQDLLDLLFTCICGNDRCAALQQKIN